MYIMCYKRVQPFIISDDAETDSFLVIPKCSLLTSIALI